MQKSSDSRTMLLTETPFKLMITLSVPAIVGMLIVGLYSFLDAIFVGQMVGSVEMGAISISYPFTLVNSGISTLIGVGSASVLSRAIGKKDQKTIDKIMGNLIMMITILSLIVTVIGIVFTRQILMLSGAQGELLNNAERYLKIVYIGSLFINFAQSANMIMRGEGLLKQAMSIMGMGAVLNIILDPILITVMNKNNMGIEGAAIATVIAQVMQAFITLIYFIKASKKVRINKIRIETTLIPEIAGVGFSAMLMQVMQLLQQTVLYNIASHYGNDTWQILLGAALRVQMFAFIPLWGMSQGFQPAVGTNYGAKQYDRVRKITKVFIFGVTILSLIFYLPVEIAPKAVLSLFITDPQIVAQGAGHFRILFSTYIVLGAMITVITLLQSLGRAAKASLLVMLRQVILFIPMAIVIPMIANLGITGVWIAPAFTDGLIGVVSFIFMATELKNMTKEDINMEMSSVNQH